MKRITTLLCLGAFAVSASAQEAKLVMESAGGGMPEGSDYSIQPNGYNYGAKLSFLVKGENFVRVDKDSLNADGWKMGSFPKVSKEGDYASFTIEKKGDFVGKLSEVKVSGKITVITGSKTEKKTVVANTTTEKEVGVFKVKLKIEEKAWGNGVTVTGPTDDIKSIFIKKDGKEVKSTGWSSYGGKSKTYTFKGIADNTEVIIEYWTDLGSKEISFSK